MKNNASLRLFGLLLIAAVMGGIFSFGLSKYFNEATPPSSVASSIPAQLTSASLIPGNAAMAMPFSFTEAAEKSMPSAVHIKSKMKTQMTGYYHNPFFDMFGDQFFGIPQRPHGTDPQYQESTGSGVIISADGLIVTNNHVVEDADIIEVIINNKQSYEAKIIGTDPTTDIALIQVQAKNLTPIRFADSDNVKVGDWVLAVGNPFNLESTVTAGIVSAKGRNLSILKDRSAIESFIQTDAAVNPGNSGGALVNISGDLIGINTAIASPTGAYAGYAFAVPINIVKKVADDLLTHGIVQRGYLGVNIRDLDNKLAEEKGLNLSQGVYLEGIVTGGAGDEAGLQVGDIITSIDGHEVKSTPELQELVARHRPGDKLEITIQRDGRTLSKFVSLKNRAGNTNLVTKASEKTSALLGVKLQELDETDLQEYGIDNGVQITKIEEGKIARYTNIREGFIITSINDHPVKNIADMEKYLNSGRGQIIIEGRYPGKAGSYYYAFDM